MPRHVTARHVTSLYVLDAWKQSKEALIQMVARASGQLSKHQHATRGDPPWAHAAFPHALVMPSLSGELSNFTFVTLFRCPKFAHDTSKFPSVSQNAANKDPAHGTARIPQGSTGPK